MAQNIKDILAKVSKGIAKTNLYSISIPNKLPDIEFNGKGTQLPSSELGVIEVPYRGRKLKVPGQRTFAEWTVTIMETEEMGVRAALEGWMNMIDHAETGSRESGQMVDITVKLLKQNGSPSITYILYGAFPTSIATVDLSFDEQTAPLEYQVTFNYSLHTVQGGGGSNGGGGLGGGFDFGFGGLPPGSVIS